MLIALAVVSDLPYSCRAESGLMV